MRWLRCGIPMAGLPVALAIFLSGSALCRLAAAEDSPAPGNEPPAAKDPAAEGKQPDGGDLYRLPAGDDVQSLIGFIQRVASFEPSSQAEASEYQSKAPAAIEAAAEKILKLEKDPQSNTAKQARMILMNIRINNVDNLDAKQQRELVEMVTKSLGAGELTQNNLRLAMSLATNLEYGGNPELAAEAYQGIAKALAGGDNETFRELAKKFEGAHRRLTSIGKPLEIAGRTVDGKPFDWNSYRGKVVLVDVWATWCGPCRQELPNIRKNYDKYHAQGFDVVGVSIDEDRDALVSFLAEEKPPWATLQDGGDDPKTTSLANHYGIFGIPATFLVDRQGNVIATHARGEKLGPQIEKALAAEKPSTANPSDEKPSSGKPRAGKSKPGK